MKPEKTNGQKNGSNIWADFFASESFKLMLQFGIEQWVRGGYREYPSLPRSKRFLSIVFPRFFCWLERPDFGHYRYF